MSAAFTWHLFGPFFYATAVVGWFYLLACVLRGRDPLNVKFDHFATYLIACVCGLFVYWGVRLATGTTP